MIYFAIVSRSSDGLALVANSDSPQMSTHPGLEDAYRKLKLLSRISARFPDRCTLPCDSYAIHFITALDLSLLVLCDVTYPQVLAFSFLNDLQRQFLQFFDKAKVMSVQRPYALIDFASSYSQYLPLHLIGIISLSLSCFCAVLNFSRGVHVFNETHSHIDATFDIEHYQTGATFFVCCFLSLYQAYLTCCPLKRRKPLACATLGSICICQLYLWDHRSIFGLIFHVTVACYGTFVIMTRQVRNKLPQYTL